MCGGCCATYTASRLGFEIMDRADRRPGTPLLRELIVYDHLHTYSTVHRNTLTQIIRAH